MIFKEDCMTIILEKFPEFLDNWKKHLKFWDGEEPGLCNDLSAFSTFVIENLSKMKEERRKEIFNVMEDILCKGEESVKEAVVTCFLENLQNSTEPGKFSGKSFVGYLGTRAREYCIAWDKLTGVKTDGL